MRSSFFFFQSLFLVVFVTIAYGHLFVNAPSPTPQTSSVIDGIAKHTPLALGHESVTVQTKLGQTTGFRTASSGSVFYGIPFAQPPVGDLRLAPPQNITSFDQDRILAQSFPNSCIQDPFQLYGQNASLSEDCLYLNIYTPSSANLNEVSEDTQNDPENIRIDTDDGLPVMVWIYGGSFVSGSANLYNGTNLADMGNVIVVTLNYRLGPFGFLSTESLLNESGTTGFYGILDQQAAFRFVQENIAQYGGNPNDVTMFGESAGAISTCTHLAAPGSNGLFQRALMESGFCTVWPWETGLETSELLTNSLNCKGSNMNDCLRNATVTEIMNAIPLDPKTNTPVNFWPTVHGDELPDQPSYLIGNKTFNDFDSLVLGTNLDEYALWICPNYLNNLTDVEYNETSVAEWGTEIAQEVLKQYPPSNYVNATHASIAAWSDYMFHCPTKLLANQLSSFGVPVYMYSFQHQSDFLILVDGIDLASCLGVAHAQELVYVWPNIVDSVYDIGLPVFTDEEVSLSNHFLRYWTNFARYSNPNGNSTDTDIAFWPPYNTTTSTYMQLTIPDVSPQNDFDGDFCNMWYNEPPIF